MPILMDTTVATQAPGEAADAKPSTSFINRQTPTNGATVHSSVAETSSKSRQRSRRKHHDDADDPSKRRCVSTACIACR